MDRGSQYWITLVSKQWEFPAFYLTVLSSFQCGRCQSWRRILGNLTQCRLLRLEIGAREKFCGIGSFDYHVTNEHIDDRVRVVVIISIQMTGEIFWTCLIYLWTCLRFEWRPAPRELFWTGKEGKEQLLYNFILRPNCYIYSQVYFI